MSQRIKRDYGQVHVRITAKELKQIIYHAFCPFNQKTLVINNKLSDLFAKWENLYVVIRDQWVKVVTHFFTDLREKKTHQVLYLI